MSPDPADSIRQSVEEAERAAVDIAALADSLVEYSNAVKRDVNKLIEGLGDAVTRTQALAESGGGQQDPPADDALAPSDGARLLATQMMVGGSSREEIEGRLRNEFGIENTGSMLDKIFGSEAIETEP